MYVILYSINQVAHYTLVTLRNSQKVHFVFDVPGIAGDSTYTLAELFIPEVSQEMHRYFRCLSNLTDKYGLASTVLQSLYLPKLIFNVY